MGQAVNIEKLNFKGYIWKGNTTENVGIMIFPFDGTTPTQQWDQHVIINGKKVMLQQFIVKMTAAVNEYIKELNGSEPRGSSKVVEVEKKKVGFNFSNFDDE